MNIISIKDLNFSYGENIILKNINLDIKSNQYHCIIGNNGSGKSTLAKLIASVLSHEGEVKIIDNEKVGLVFQNPDNQFVTEKVKYDLAFGLENKGILKREMEEIINDITKKMDVESFLERNISELSGGQKQRVATSGMLCIASKVLILDEATSMLDPIAKKNFLEYNRLYTKNNDVTLISITHDMDEAAMADNVIVMENGEVILEGIPHDVFKSALIDSSLKPFYYNCFEGLNIINDDDLEELICKLK